MTQKLIPPVILQLVLLCAGIIGLAWTAAWLITPVAEEVRDMFTKKETSSFVIDTRSQQKQTAKTFPRKTPNKGIPMAYPSTPAIIKINEAKMAYDKDDLAEARRLWRESLDLKPFHPGWIWHDIGMCSEEMGLYDDAIEAYTHAMELAVSVHDKANSYELRAHVYYRQSRYEEALADLEEALRLAPNHFTSQKLLTSLKKKTEVR